MSPASSRHRIRCCLSLLLWGVCGPIAVAPAALTFNFLPEPGMDATAFTAFQAAGARWSAAFSDDVVVNVQVGFSSLGPGVVGQSGQSFIETSYSNTRLALTLDQTSADDATVVAHLPAGESFLRVINLTSDNPAGAGSAELYADEMNRVGITLANARALGLYASQDGTLDALIRFSSDFAFDFDPADGITPGLFDFVGAATHELGHALGFVSGVDDLDAAAGAQPGGNFSDNLIDLFRYSSLSAQFGLTDYAVDTRPKYFSLDGLTAIGQFSTGVTFGDGQQASHWLDGVGFGLMDPTVAPGELMEISLLDLRAFDAIGWNLVPEPASGVVLLGALAGGLAGRRRRGWPVRPTRVATGR